MSYRVEEWEALPTSSFPPMPLWVPMGSTTETSPLAYMASINHGLWIIEHLCCKTNGLWSVNHTEKHLQGLLALFITPKSVCSFINRTSVKICKNYSQSLAESYIALAGFFFPKLLMVISSIYDSCFIPVLAESLLFPFCALGLQHV